MGGAIFSPFLVTLRSKEKISDEGKEKLDDFSVVFFRPKLAALVSFKRTREVGKEYCDHLSASQHRLEHLTKVSSLFDAVCRLSISWKREEDEELDCICKIGGTCETIGQRKRGGGSEKSYADSHSLASSTICSAPV